MSLTREPATSVEGGNLPSIWLPEVFSLIKSPLRCRPVLAVRSFWIHRLECTSNVEVKWIWEANGRSKTGYGRELEKIMRATGSIIEQIDDRGVIDSVLTNDFTLRRPLETSAMGPRSATKSSSKNINI